MARRWWQYAPDGRVVEWGQQDLPNQCTIWRASWLNQFVAWKRYIDQLSQKNIANATWLDPDSPEWVRPSITNVQTADFWHSLIPNCGYSSFYNAVYSRDRCTEFYDPDYKYDASKWPIPPDRNTSSATDDSPWMVGWDPAYPDPEDFENNEDYWAAEAAYVQKDPTLERGHIITRDPERVIGFKCAPPFVHRVWGSVIHPQKGNKDYGIDTDKLRKYLEMLRRYYDSLDFISTYVRMVSTRGFFTKEQFYYFDMAEDEEWLLDEGSKCEYVWRTKTEYDPETDTEKPVEVSRGVRHICCDSEGDPVLVEKNNGHVCHDAKGNVICGKCKADHKHADGTEVKYNVQHVCHRVELDEDGEIESVHEIAPRNARKYEHSCYDEDGNPVVVSYNERHDKNIGEWRGDEHQCYDENGGSFLCKKNGGHICKDDTGGTLYEQGWEREYEYDQEGNAVKVPYRTYVSNTGRVGCTYTGRYRSTGGEFTTEIITKAEPTYAWAFPNIDFEEAIICKPSSVYGNQQSGAKSKYGAGKVLRRGYWAIDSFSEGEFGDCPTADPEYDEDGRTKNTWGDMYSFYIVPVIPETLPDNWRGPDWPETPW